MNLVKEQFVINSIKSVWFVHEFCIQFGHKMTIQKNCLPSNLFRHNVLLCIHILSCSIINTFKLNLSPTSNQPHSCFPRRNVFFSSKNNYTFNCFEQLLCTRHTRCLICSDHFYFATCKIRFISRILKESTRY